jgi:hypothetical protein
MEEPEMRDFMHLYCRLEGLCEDALRADLREQKRASRQLKKRARKAQRSEKCQAPGQLEEDALPA